MLVLLAALWSTSFQADTTKHTFSYSDSFYQDISESDITYTNIEPVQNSNNFVDYLSHIAITIEKDINEDLGFDQDFSFLTDFFFIHASDSLQNANHVINASNSNYSFFEYKVFLQKIYIAIQQFLI